MTWSEGGAFEYKAGVARDSWSVVPGSGTGDSRGLRDEESYAAHHGESTSFTLDYETA